MLKRLLYSWSTNGLWEIFSNGALKSSMSCPIGIDMSKMKIKAVYNPDFHEIIITAEHPVQKKMVVFDIEDATPQRPHSASRQKSIGGGEQSEQPDGRTQ